MAGSYHVDDYGACGDGVTNDRGAILATIAAASAAGGGEVCFGPKTYLVNKDPNGPWAIDVTANNIWFIGYRDVTKVKLAAGQGSVSTVVFRVNGRTNVCFIGIICDGNWGAVIGTTTTQAGINHTNQVDPKNHGLFIRGSDNILVERCRFTQMYGDGIWMGVNANDDLADITRDVEIKHCTFDIIARNAISFGAPAHRVAIESNKMSCIYTTCIDAEPQGLFDGVRNVTVHRNSMDGWWNGQHSNIMMSIVGGQPDGHNMSAAARAWTVTKNEIHGSIHVFSAKNIVIDKNTIWTDFSSAANSIAPILVDHAVDAITISNNDIYDNTPKSLYPGDPHNGAICIQLYGGGSINMQPAGVRLHNNKIHARNGVHGVWISATGGFTVGDGTPLVDQYNGTLATSVTANTLKDTTASWPVNKWAGWMGIMGGRVAMISGNSSDELFLEPAFHTLDPSAWFTPTGERTSFPSLGAYQITSVSGLVELTNNDIDCGGDGAAVGGNGVYVYQDRAGAMIRIKDNTIKNATTFGVTVIGATAKPGSMLEITDNTFWDDRGTAALLSSCIRFPDVQSLSSWIMPPILARNRVARGGATDMSLGAGNTGVWLVEPGSIQRWAGYGVPTMVAPNGSLFHRLDGASMSTLYTRVNGAWVVTA